jgi:hypothetical protein
MLYKISSQPSRRISKLKGKPFKRNYPSISKHDIPSFFFCAAIFRPFWNWKNPDPQDCSGIHKKNTAESIEMN